MSSNYEASENTTNCVFLNEDKKSCMENRGFSPGGWRYDCYLQETPGRGVSFVSKRIASAVEVWPAQ